MSKSSPALNASRKRVHVVDAIREDWGTRHDPGHVHTDNIIPQGGVPNTFVNVHQLTGTKDGMVYLANRFRVRKSAAWRLCLGHDGGCRVFVDGKPVLTQAKRVNPAEPDRSCLRIKLKKGTHTVVVALDLDRGLGWGIYFRWKKVVAEEFPQRLACQP